MSKKRSPRGKVAEENRQNKVSIYADSETAIHHLGQQLSGLATLIMDGDMRQARIMVSGHRVMVEQALEFGSITVTRIRVARKGSLDDVTDYAAPLRMMNLHQAEEAEERFFLSRWALTVWAWLEASPPTVWFRSNRMDRKVTRRRARALRWKHEEQDAQEAKQLTVNRSEEEPSDG